MRLCRVTNGKTIMYRFPSQRSNICAYSPEPAIYQICRTGEGKKRGLDRKYVLYIIGTTVLGESAYGELLTRSFGRGSAVAPLQTSAKSSQSFKPPPQPDLSFSMSGFIFFDNSMS